MTPCVQYAYSELPSGENHSRLVSITYPNGRVISYDYGDNDLNDRISRVAEVFDGTTSAEAITYLGLDRIVRRDIADTIQDTLIKLSGESDGDGGDQYTGLDRFNRIVDKRWLSGTTALDRYQYGYDRSGNRLFRDNRLYSAHGEVYEYDNLNRVIDMQRGTLNSGRDGISGTPGTTQSWDLDIYGNTTTLTTNGVTEERAHNGQNELTARDSYANTFDDNGNLTVRGFTGRTIRYDGWNRVVEQKIGATSEIVYRYDGLGRRVREGARTIFYNSNWQAIEERITSSGVVAVQYVWSRAYIDAMLYRYRDPTLVGSLSEKIFATHDANFNVTAIVSTSAAVLGRFRYETYGLRVLYAGSTNDFLHSFAGGKIDSVTGRIHFRNRDYDIGLMRWISRDPIGYQGSEWNLYEYVESSPQNYVDPYGERWGVAPQSSPTQVPPRNNTPNIPQPGVSGPLPKNPPRGPSPLMPHGGWPGTPGTQPRVKDPYPPGFPEPGINPGPLDPNYWPHVRQCWKEFYKNPLGKLPPLGKTLDHCLGLEGDDRYDFCAGFADAQVRARCYSHCLESQTNWNNFCRSIYLK